MNDLDERILAALQSNARRKNVDLARELGVAPSTVLERVRRLEEQGWIEGYRALIRPSSIGLTIQSFVAVILDRHEVEAIQLFEQGIQQLSYIRVCYHVAGRFDYLLQVVARDLEHLGELIKNQIASIPGIGKVESFPIYSEVKLDKGWPIARDLAEELLTKEGQDVQKNDP
jgi:Lrp/AsnC family leucine-responsive transcriptional regulator